MTDMIHISDTLGSFYIIMINVLAFLTFGYDKRQAVKRKWRVPEKTLFLLALLGGSVGAWIGMQTFRHKTKHWTFKAGIPMIFALQCVAFSYFSL